MLMWILYWLVIQLEWLFLGINIQLLFHIVISYDTTQPVTMDDMIYHCKAVRRGAPNRFIVGDMPFGSYEV